MPSNPDSTKSGEFLSSTVIRVVGTKRMGGWAQIYRDVWTSVEFVGEELAVGPNGQVGRVRPLGRAGLLIYVYLATHTSGQTGTCDGETDVSQARLSSVLGLSGNTVRRGVADLKSRGLLTVTRGSAEAGERRVPTYVYQLHDPPSLTRSGESRVLTNDPNMDHESGDQRSKYGSCDDPNLDHRRHVSRSQKTSISRLGAMDNSDPTQNRSERVSQTDVREFLDGLRSGVRRMP